MKQILEVKWITDDVVKVRLETTKRRTLMLKILKIAPFSCLPNICPLYYDCSMICSPLPKYRSFSQFCNKIFEDYPDLKQILKVESINQVIPIKINIIK